MDILHLRARMIVVLAVHTKENSIGCFETPYKKFYRIFDVDVSSFPDFRHTSSSAMFPIWFMDAWFP